MYSTDNGPHMNTWPDGAMTPFRNEKNSNWEGAFRVPEMVRWPGKIKAGTVSNEIISHTDWLPTLLAAAGDPDINEKLKKGYNAGEKQFRVHIMATISCPLGKKGRDGLIYFSDDGDLVGLRYDNWKIVFAEQRAIGTIQIWMEPFTFLRIPKFFNLRTDPFERADITSNTYFDWMIDRAFLMYAAQFLVRQFLETFQEYPPRMKAASFSIDQVLNKMEQALNID
jgi:arylsulfatase